jgi:hypothetical protein
MRITNQNQIPVPSQDNSNSKDAAPAPGNDVAASASSPTSSTSRPYPVSLVPSFELLSLTSTLQHIPPVREDVIAETVRRLATGQLKTPAAVEQTARAILGL